MSEIRKIRLYHHAWVVLRGWPFPLEVREAPGLQGLYLIRKELYEENGRPLMPKLFPEPPVDLVLDPGWAKDMGLTSEYDPNSGYRWEEREKNVRKV